VVAAARALPPAAPAAPQAQVASLPDASLATLRARYRRPTAIPFPRDNPFNADVAELGRLLFFDPRLSGSNLLSCASCHNPSFAWGDGQPRATGHGMRVLGRRTPTILNGAWGEVFFWDGRADTLEEQAVGPMSAPGEMNQLLDDLPTKLAAIAGYRSIFERAFPGQPITVENVARAIATFERTVVSDAAPFDRWVEGDEGAISPAAQRGFVLFNGRANCASCHSGWNFTNDSFHDIGLASDDVGRERVMPGIAGLRHAFKTPGLRDVTLRGPYMHDGSVPDLEAVIRHYENGFIRRPSLSADMRAFTLSDEERRELIAFLETLTAPRRDFAVPPLPR
jgi:cytochrome c peroxidase